MAGFTGIYGVLPIHYSRYPTDRLHYQAGVNCAELRLEYRTNSYTMQRKSHLSATLLAYSINKAIVRVPHYAAGKSGFRELTSLQVDVIQAIGNGHDVFGVLPTMGRVCVLHAFISSLAITLKYLNTAMVVLQGSVFHEQAQPNPFNKRYHNRTSAWGLLHVSKLTIPIIA